MQRSHSFKWASFVKPSKSPTKPVAEVASPQPSPQRMEHNIGNGSRHTDSTYTDKSRASAATLVGSEASTSLHISHTSSNTLQPNPIPARPQRQDSQDNLKSFKVSLDDPAWKVLPAALKKYKINNDDWQNYAMFICYGAPGTLPRMFLCRCSRHLRYVLCRKPYRAVSQLRREAFVALPEAERCKEEPSVHAQAHQGYPVTYRRRPAETGCSQGIGLRRRDAACEDCLSAWGEQLAGITGTSSWTSTETTGIPLTASDIWSPYERPERSVRMARAHVALGREQGRWRRRHIQEPRRVWGRSIGRSRRQYASRTQGDASGHGSIVFSCDISVYGGAGGRVRCGSVRDLSDVRS